MKGVETLTDAAILLARVGLGAVFVAHGWQKFFTLGLGRVGEQFAAYGVPQPQVTVAVVAGVELIAGIALIAGILTPLAGILLGVDMAGALLLSPPPPRLLFPPHGQGTPGGLGGLAARPRCGRSRPPPPAAPFRRAAGDRPGGTTDSACSFEPHVSACRARGRRAGRRCAHRSRR